MIIGIDPGLDGGLALVDSKENILETYGLKDLSELLALRQGLDAVKKDTYLLAACSDILSDWFDKYAVTKIVTETVFLPQTYNFTLVRRLLLSSYGLIGICSCYMDPANIHVIDSKKWLAYFKLMKKPHSEYIKVVQAIDSSQDPLMSDGIAAAILMAVWGNRNL